MILKEWYGAYNRKGTDGQGSTNLDSYGEGSLTRDIETEIGQRK